MSGEPMKIGVVGLGSMGKRRVRDLLDLGADVVGFDVRDDRCTQGRDMFGIATRESFAGLLAERPRAIVISTPPDVHARYYELCYEHRLPYFSEANIFTPAAAWFAAREASSGVRGYPSATWKFHPLVEELCRTVQVLGTDRINTVSHQYGGFLPDWHPWERYSDFYAGRKRTSAAREMVPFELEILMAAFGPVAEVRAIKDQARDWDAELDDTYFILLRFASGLVGNLTIELHQVAPVRTTRVSTADTGLILDMGAQELRTYDKAGDSWRFVKPRALRQNWGFQFEHVYREEIRHFLLALEGAPYPKTWAEDRHLSDVLFAAELSHFSGCAVRIADVETAYDGLSWINE